jgi:hypothetical protein
MFSNFNCLGKEINALALPVEVKFDECASGGVFVTEPSRKFICNEVLEKRLVGGIGD